LISVSSYLNHHVNTTYDSISSFEFSYPKIRNLLQITCEINRYKSHYECGVVCHVSQPATYHNLLIRGSQHDKHRFYRQNNKFITWRNSFQQIIIIYGSNIYKRNRSFYMICFGFLFISMYLDRFILRRKQPRLLALLILFFKSLTSSWRALIAASAGWTGSIWIISSWLAGWTWFLVVHRYPIQVKKVENQVYQRNYAGPGTGPDAHRATNICNQLPNRKCAHIFGDKPGFNWRKEQG